MTDKTLISETHRKKLQDSATRRKLDWLAGRYLHETDPEAFTALLGKALDAERQKVLAKLNT
jgi:ribosomal 50S subunit-associated protein YjgA (DUF615 family)